MRDATQRLKVQREQIDELTQEVALLRAALALTEAQRDRLRKRSLGAEHVYERPN
jgi:hypothetical protein